VLKITLFSEHSANNNEYNIGGRDMGVRQAVWKWLGSHGKVASWMTTGVIVGAAGSAVVLASIPDPSGVIHACYSTGVLGRVRIIDNASQTCNNNEAAITWNQTGPQGPAGAQGPAGGSSITSFTDRNFNSVDWRYQDFSGKDFRGSSLTNAILIGADLHDSNFTGTGIGGGSYDAANFSGSNFTDGFIRVPSTSSVGTDPSGALTDFRNTNLTNTEISSWGAGPKVSGDFRGANLTGTIFHWVINSNFTGVDFRPAALLTGGGGSSTISSFSNSNFTSANFSGIALTSVQFNNNNFTGTDFTNSQLDSVNFSGSDLSSAVLTGATWSNTTCSDGTNSDANGGTCIGHLVP
jgi:uncharacterized protein YjbI with pentapeptide repeats